jgi:uncharacterized integral membrane protein (TIGR00698 family)
LAIAAFALRQIPGVGNLSPMILAIVLGIGFHNVIGTPAAAHPGVTFAMRRILRAAVVLLGLQLTAQQIAEVGLQSVAVIAATLVLTFVFTAWVGRILGVDRKLTDLIAAGTSICGASAIIAANTVIDAKDEDVTYAVACVTLFGSLAMFIYPALPGLFHLDPHAYGLWAGSSIHETAQVVAAAFQDGKEAGNYGTIAKLTRISMLAPTILALGALANRRSSGAAQKSGSKIPIPYFVLGFVALVIVNSLITIPPVEKQWIVLGTTFLLTLALAAMGLETDIRKLRAKGVRPLLLGAVAWLFIAGFSLTLVKLIS